MTMTTANLLERATQALWENTKLITEMVPGFKAQISGLINTVNQRNALLQAKDQEIFHTRITVMALVAHFGARDDSGQISAELDGEWLKAFNANHWEFNGGQDPETMRASYSMRRKSQEECDAIDQQIADQQAKMAEAQEEMRKRQLGLVAPDGRPAHVAAEKPNLLIQ